VAGQPSNNRAACHGLEHNRSQFGIKRSPERVNVVAVCENTRKLKQVLKCVKTQPDFAKENAVLARPTYVGRAFWVPAGRAAGKG
jgi:hypothetical protein